MAAKQEITAKYEEMEVNMEILRDLDSFVAEYVMGWKDGEHPRRKILNDGDFAPSSQFSPSTNIEHAWEVVEKMKDLPYGPGDSNPIFELRIWWSSGTQKWSCRTWFYEASAETAPMAICLVALKAVGFAVTKLQVEKK